MSRKPNRRDILIEALGAGVAASLGANRASAKYTAVATPPARSPNLIQIEEYGTVLPNRFSRDHGFNARTGNRRTESPMTAREK